MTPLAKTTMTQIRKPGQPPASMVLASTIPYPDAIHLSIEGGWGAGKTHIGLDGPGPIGVLDIDRGSREMVDWFISQRPDVEYRYHQATYVVPPKDSSWKGEAGDQKYLNHVKEVLTPHWESTRKTMIEVAESGYFKTFVIDGAAELFDLCKLARVGAAEQIQFNLHSVYKMDFEGLIKALRLSGANLIFCSRLKPRYKSVVNEATGKTKIERTAFQDRAGWADLEYTFPAAIRVNRPEFYPTGALKIPRTYEFRKVRYPESRALEGTIYQGDLSFMELAMMLRPDVDPAAWV